MIMMSTRETLHTQGKLRLKGVSANAEVTQSDSLRSLNKWSETLLIVSQRRVIDTVLRISYEMRKYDSTPTRRI